ncbi:hypothetical protein WICANDRAFT_83571 [Wickerhamomyces anomalus NRRL Y-366-8]|uniref:Ribosome quality control complex subunit 1 n=1 Tax=Wickerhamomyces anomalus (strain ATCC 58044 / CBS 1984 / NCYC 433 / NRRL Y-366-8) TaxID=683960 RepID=A0A1E3P7N8_WICAA|nr:uncharacterized protein WICANDRAFT_83571 [Wickerhamomyces anomalus NRRL Y-366-8]ODQ61435.1 hypothetical protein WICANDRAFT_83571 [Wickerhamomyces anomalus NRRL Y-366-8]
MSSRALRRLEKQREQTRLAEENNDVEEVEEESVEPVKKAQNIFALIGGEEDDDEDDEDQEKVESETEDVKASVHLPTKSQKKNKKKKNKGKKKAEPKEVDEDSDDELDKIIKELNRKENRIVDTTEIDAEEEEAIDDEVTHEILDSSFSHFTPLKQYKSASLLKIDPRDLDPDNEFKKLFGNLSAEALNDADSTTSTSVPPEILQQIKRLSKVVRGWGGRDRRSIPGTTRKLILTKIRDDWIPTPKKDINMEELSIKEVIDDKAAESEDWVDVIKDDVVKMAKYGIKHYKFERGAESKIANSQFYASVVVTPNHENLMQLLPRFPYHVETILQVALILIRQGDKSNSNGLVERALFTFDRGFKQNFDLSNGLTRLPFNYYLNRQFYLAVFRYIEILSKKGTLFTAFTYAKLLLALSPADDPYGVRYFIDFYAIVSAEYKYLTEIVDSPLVTTYSKWYTPGIAYSTVLAYLYLGNERKAKEYLKKAFIKHPFTGYKLLEAIGLASDIPVNDYSIFEVGQETELSTEAYLLRAPIVWKEANHRKFLHDTLLGFINNKIKFQPTQDGVIPMNFLRFAILSGEGKVMAKIPPEIWEQNEIYEFDVLPPKLGYNDEEIMEMVRNLSLQDAIDQQVPGAFPE